MVGISDIMLRDYSGKQEGRIALPHGPQNPVFPSCFIAAWERVGKA
jgi:hypothetical protein